MEEITLNRLDLGEVLRYLGYGERQPDEETLALAEDCEAELLAAARPRWRSLTIKVLGWDRKGVHLEGGLLLPGDSIKMHLLGCDRAVLFCVTLSAQVDALLRKIQTEDMARAVVLDSCASVAVEQACDQVEERIKQEFPGCCFPYRYSPGYGDLPISLQGEILALLDAPRKIGLCATANHILTPRKSVTAILGVAKGWIEREPKESCARCFLKGRCSYQLRGKTCGA